MKNKIFTISGPGASGKETIINALLKKDKNTLTSASIKLEMNRTKLMNV